MLHLAIPYNPTAEVGPHLASYNFVKSLSGLSTKFKARKVTVCWDGGIPESRRKNCPTYKQGKVKSTKDRSRFESFGRNRAFLMDLLPSLCVRTLVADGFEGDDLVFGVCNADIGNCSIVSGDMDLSQLISSRVEFSRPGKPVIRLSNISDIILDTSYDIRPRSPRDIVLFKALRGDPSDQIPPIVKPKSVCALWDKLGRENIGPTIPEVRKACADLGIVLDDRFEANFATVDLIRSGVAGDAISHALTGLGQAASVNESTIFQKMLDVGIQPGYLHSLIPSFHYLS